MNLRQFYKFLTEQFEHVDGHAFANPTVHLNFGVQFIHEEGFPCSPLVPNPVDIQFNTPFAGPFYDLQLAGILLYGNRVIRKRWKPICPIVEITPEVEAAWAVQTERHGSVLKGAKAINGDYLAATAIWVKAPHAALKGFLRESGIKIYNRDGTDKTKWTLITDIDDFWKNDGIVPTNESGGL